MSVPFPRRRARRHWAAQAKLIVQCASVGDVVTAVRAARECDLEIGVRCGGHNIAPTGRCGR
jgi:FAD/FMN-containing dehydrogenase